MTPTTSTVRNPERKPIDVWRWVGRIFLVLILLSSRSCRWSGCC